MESYVSKVSMKVYFLIFLTVITIHSVEFDPPIHSLRTTVSSASLPSYSTQQSSFLIYNNNFRSVFNGLLSDSIDFQLHLNHSYTTTNQKLPSTQLASPYELFSHHLLKDKNNTTKIDRLQFSFQSNGYDYVIGRQAISFGTSHFISTMDVINPFAPGTIDSSFKPGIDAIRIQKALSNTGEIEFIFAANQINENNAYFLRSRILKNQIDYEFLVGRFRQHNMIGFGFEGEVQSQSIWGELALIRYDNNLLDLNQDQHNNLSFNLGFDYHPNDGESISVSWFHQESGAKSSRDFNRVLTNPSFKEQFAYLKGTNYLNLTYQRKIKPLVDFSSSIIFNLEDQSSYIQPKLHVNTSNNSSLTIFYTFGLGTKMANGSLLSEFGELANTVGIFSQIYF